VQLPRCAVFLHLLGLISHAKSQLQLFPCITIMHDKFGKPTLTGLYIRYIEDLSCIGSIEKSLR
ncbi:unnamed protein product, partial [Amoebophrya sp. A120]